MADNEQNSDPSGNSQNRNGSGPGIIAKIIAPIIGIALIIFAAVLITEDSGVVASRSNNAFIYLIGLVGLSLVCLPFFSDILDFKSGQDGPLGIISGKGGAAVLGIGALFIIALTQIDGGGSTDNPDDGTSKETTGEVTTDEGGDPSAEDSSEGAESSGGETEEGASEVLQDFDLDDEAILDESGPQFDEAQVPLAGIPVISQTFLPWPYDQRFEFAPNLARYRTFSNSACPSGPNGCPFAGGAAHFNAQYAQNFAVQMCVNNGGVPFECQNNLEQF